MPIPLKRRIAEARNARHPAYMSKMLSRMSVAARRKKIKGSERIISHARPVEARYLPSKAILQRLRSRIAHSQDDQEDRRKKRRTDPDAKEEQGTSADDQDRMSLSAGPLGSSSPQTSCNDQGTGVAAASKRKAEEGGTRAASSLGHTSGFEPPVSKPHLATVPKSPPTKSPPRDAYY